MMILKEFSRIVCVSLFSYQGSLFVCLSDSSFSLSQSFLFVKNFFKFFQNFLMAFVIRCLSATRLLYHIHQRLSSTFFKFFSRCFDVCVSLSSDLFTLSHVRFFVNNYFCFFQNFSNCLFRRNNSLRQLS